MKYLKKFNENLSLISGIVDEIEDKFLSIIDEYSLRYFGDRDEFHYIGDFQNYSNIVHDAKSNSNFLAYNFEYQNYGNKLFLSIFYHQNYSELETLMNQFSKFKDRLISNGYNITSYIQKDKPWGFNLYYLAICINL